MNLTELSNIVKRATQAIEASEKFAIPLLVVRAKRAASEFPEDYTIVQAANVLSKMEENGKVFLSKAEFEGLYNDLYSRNTKFAEVFVDELGKKELPTPTLMHHDVNEGDFVEVSLNRMADPVLANALSEVFDKSGKHKLYSNDMAVKAEKACLTELNSIGAAPKTVSVFAGNEDFIIVNASYETPKGMSNVLVPIEMKGELALLPTMFLSQAGFVDLSASEIKDHVFITAGKSYNVSGDSVLTVLGNAKFGEEKQLTDVDRAIMKMACGNETPCDGADGIMYQQVESIIPDVVVSESPEVMTFAKSLDTPKGEASFIFGEKAVVAGSNVIQRKLASLGYKNVQVAVAECDDKSVYYAVSLGNAGMKVPVSIVNGRVLEPKVVIAAGELHEFTVDGIKKVASSGSKDVRMMGVASPNYGLKPSELISNIKSAIAEDNFAKAEDSLSALAASENVDAYKAGLAVYMSGLGMKNGLTKQASKLEEKVETPYIMSHKIFL
jgi:hypothetical protein